VKVAMVSEHASPLAVLGGADAGGQNVHVAALSAALAALGDEVVVYTRRCDERSPQYVSMGPGVKVCHVDAGPACAIAKDDMLPFMAEFAEQLERLWTHDRPDLVHTHFWMSGLAGLEVGHRLGIPVVHTFHALGVVKQRHQGAADTSPSERVAIETSLATEMDCIIATCSDEAFELRRIGTPADRLGVVPCGVDLQGFRPDGPLLLDPHPARVVSLGRLVERKGVDDLITAVAAVPDVELVVAGGSTGDGPDPDTERLRRLASALRVSDRVRFIGPVGRREVPPLLRSATVVACVPWYEPFGIVPLEAMACARPVLATAVGGLVDTVVDGVNGVHVPARSPDAIATALDALLPDEPLLASMGRRGRERATSRYGWRTVARSTRAIYAAACASAGREGAVLR